MRHNVLIIVMTFMVIIVMTFSSFGNVFALESYSEQMNAYGSSVINIAGHHQLLIDAYHFDTGDFGSGDVLRVFYYQNTTLGPIFRNVAVFTDMPDRITFLQQLSLNTNTSVQLVDDFDLDVRREGKSKVIMIVWKQPLEVPTENWYSEEIQGFAVPPGRLILRGHGNVISGNLFELSNNWLQILTWEGYYADATFVCPSWHFGGPVGENDGENPTIIYTNATLLSGEVIIG